MGISELVSSLLQPLFDLLPRISPRPASNEYAVVDSWMFGVKEFTGPRVFVPVFTHVEYYPMADYPVDTGLQRLTTSCEKTVCVNATAIVTVVDPIQLRDRTAHENWEHWCSMIIRKHVRECATNSTWDEFLEDGDSTVYIEASDELLCAGVNLVQIVLEASTVALPLTILTPSTDE